jgi:hypothetical protein
MTCESSAFRCHPLLSRVSAAGSQTTRNRIIQVADEEPTVNRQQRLKQVATNLLAQIGQASTMGFLGGRMAKSSAASERTTMNQLDVAWMIYVTIPSASNQAT